MSIEPVYILNFTLGLSVFSFGVACFEQWKLKRRPVVGNTKKKYVLSFATQALSVANFILVAHIANQI